MKLRVRAMGFAAGTILGLAVLVSSLYSLWLGSGETIGYLEWMLPGYQRTFLGSIVGMIGGFVWGFMAGTLHAWLYNIFHKVLYKSETSD